MKDIRRDDCMKTKTDAHDAQSELIQMRRVLGSEIEIWKTFQYQFTVIHQRTQTIFALGGLAITVTGFSGQRIVASSLVSGLALVAGLVFILTALVVALFGVGRLSWASKSLGPDTDESFLEIIRIRDEKTRLFRTAMGILIIGLFWYVLSISVFLIKSTSGGS